MTTREKVILEAEDRASQAFDQASGGFERMSRTMRRLAVGGGLAIVATKLAQVGGAVLKLAVDAQEAESAFATSFGEALPEATAFVDEFANKAGFATAELKQMLAITGSVVQGIGATEAESAALSERMATLAGDVASFSNAAGGAEAVLYALQSAINGEREALKTYGLAIVETEVQERALRDTQKERAADLTRLEKAQATVNIAYEKAGKAIGDLDRTQDSAANTLRRIQARLREAGITIGEELLPAVEDLLPKIEDAIPAIVDFSTALVDLATQTAPIVAGALGHLQDLVDGLGIAINSATHVAAGGAAVLAEVLSAGLVDTTWLQEQAKAAAAANDLRIISRELRAEVEAGKPASDAYADGLLALARRSELSAEGISRFALATGASTEEQYLALRALQDYAREAGNWRPESLLALSIALAEVQARLDIGQWDGWMAAMGAAGAATATTGGILEQLPDKMPPIVDELEKMRDAAHEGAAALRDDLADEADEFITGFEKLPKRLKITMDQFDANLTKRIAAQASFWTGLTTLAEAGLGNLAEEIRSQGPEAAGLLETLTGDMERAAALDDLLGNARTDMEDLTGEYATALETYGDPVLTAMGEYGENIIAAIGEGIRNGDLAGPLLAFVRSEVTSVTGTWIPPGRTSPGGGDFTQFAAGTWSVPGTGAIQATVHGTETIFGPVGSAGRDNMVRELATALAQVMGGSSGRRVTIENLSVTVPGGTTLTEAIGRAGAEAAIEAHLS